MLIICNGTFKSGSTWLHAIVVEILKICEIQLNTVPEKYTNNTNSPTTIIESKLNKFLQEEDFIHNNYITKSHYLKKKTLVQNYSDSVCFLFITRDPKDAIVSHYYHIKHKYNINISFNLYYYLLGRYKGYEICQLNHLYKKNFNSRNFVDFSMLKDDFQKTICSLSDLLGIRKLNDSEVQDIKEATSIENLRKRIKDENLKYYSTVQKNKWKLIRKGSVGNWKSYFSNKSIRDFKNIESLKVSPFTSMVYFFLFTFRRCVFSIE